MSRLLLVSVALLALFIVPTSAHVRLLFTGTPIRNALSSKLDGQYSVSGPCGGVSTFGAQGVTTVVSGSVMQLKIAYNGGHQDPANAFHAAYVCGSYTTGSSFSDSALKLSSQPATLSSPGLLPLTDGTASVAATDSSTAGYTLEFKAPTLSGSTAQTCVISLMDQRNWGGCVDINLVPAGSSQGSGGNSTSATKSPCTHYCDEEALTCKGANAQFPAPVTGLNCLTSCANYSSVPGEVYSGDNLQCRQTHLDYAGAYNDTTLHCPHSGTASSVCFQSGADGTRAPSACFKYCNAVFANCAANNFYASKNLCMEKCATFLDTGLGSDQAQPSGNNVQCRLYAASDPNTCAAANPTPTGSCSYANPLIAADDTISAVYTTVAGQCDTAVERATNTISGCCCITGQVTVIHVKGYAVATVTTNFTTTGGEMCNAGNMTIVNGLNPSKNASYTFDSPVTVPSTSTSFLLRQTDTTATDMAGTFTIGPDDFNWNLASTGGSYLLVLTNNAPSTRNPRVCSTQASYTTRIDSTNMPPPNDPDNPTNNYASATAQVSIISMIMVVLVTFFKF